VCDVGVHLFQQSFRSGEVMCGDGQLNAASGAHS